MRNFLPYMNPDSKCYESFTNNYLNKTAIQEKVASSRFKHKALPILMEIIYNV